ncbi:ATP-binding protein [Paenibacillus silvae]|uniref:ATP-binding protein n=1 Tax=Paenibacillus silvae TaxID=1325358 RepID=A0A2W6NFF3_9BACL|nr:ATP-binding protein [Paenibacillus silvae]MCK6073535.1 ATP-binding protein [Paenibacillus silvae]MCK6148989.1 ATP-binding protein [Paenibacillus silvae]MCK6267288.1 ATP-binding protein [Paenibacillus silvae]PZT54667.1 ATP-binding protein [Paenibacillus silvae]
MNILHLVPVIFMTLLMTFQANYYFDSVLGKTRRKSRRTIYLMVFVLLNFLYLAIRLPSVLSTALALIFIFTLAHSYRVELKLKIMFTVMYAALLTIVNIISVYVVSVIDGIDYLKEAVYGPEAIWLFSKVLLLGCSIMFVVIPIVHLIAKRRSFGVHYRSYLLFLIVTVITVYQINVISIYSEKNIYYIFSVLGSLFLNVFIVYVFDNIVEKAQLAHENEQLQRQMDYQDANYEKTVHSFKSIKSIIHDINQQFLYIEECVKRNELTAATEHMHVTLNAIEHAYQRVNSGNLVIDALVTNTLAVGQANGIRVDTRIQLHSQHVGIERYDLCVVLGNILDNAVEASKKVRIAEDRYMLVSIHSTASALVIQIMNHTSQPAADLKSDKTDSEFHGFGLTNISRICSKYGGHMTIEQGQGSFNNMVVLPYNTNNV